MQSYPALLLGIAVPKLFPGTKPIRWKATESGFFYEFALEVPYGPEFVSLIEEKMRSLKSIVFEKKTMMRENSASYLSDNKHDLTAQLIVHYPKNMIDLVVSKEGIDVAFFPLDNQELGHFTLTSAVCERVEYPYLGKIVLWRIEGVAFKEKKELKLFSKSLEQSKKRDLLKQAKARELIDFFQGEPFWLPKGLQLRQSIASLWQEALKKQKAILISHSCRQKLQNTLETALFENDSAPLRSVENLYAHLYSKTEKRAPCTYASLIERRGTLLPLEEEGLFQSAVCFGDEVFTYCTRADLLFCLGTHIKAISALMKQLGFVLAIEVSIPKNATYTEALLQHCKEIGDVTVAVKSTELPRISLFVKDLRFRSQLVSFIEIESVIIDSVPVFRICLSYLYSYERALALLLERNDGFLPMSITPEQVRIVQVGGASPDFIRAVETELQQAEVRFFKDSRDLPLSEKVYRAIDDRVPFFVVIGANEEKSERISVRALQEETPAELVDYREFARSLVSARELMG